MFRRILIVCSVLFSACAFLPWSQIALAGVTTMRLICAYEKTLDLSDLDFSPTSGEDLITIRYEEDGSAIIKIQDLGAEFTGTVSDDEIVGGTHWTFNDVIITQNLTINRFSGAFTLTFNYGDGAGLIHHGTCRAVDKPLF